MGELTAEIRWWREAETPVEVLGWYGAGTVEPSNAEARTDKYIPTGSAEIGIKYRGGGAGIEAKSLVERRTIGALPVGIWIKQPFELRRDDNAIAIVKDRRMRLFDSTGDALSEVPLGPDETPLDGERPARGCAVELARVTCNQTAWWSVCFEAYGNLDHVENTLARTLDHLGPLPPALAEARIASYPAWLLGCD